mgnify:FL=1|tara:strand:- start:423 stop:620 length:198 start_codon:yes stop_codon:yes gene_type:complete
MEKPESPVSEIIDEIISLSTPKPKVDLQQELMQDKINYLIWQVDVAVKELQAEVDKLKQNNKEAS